MNNKGFTLIELLLVVAIIGLLSMVAIGNIFVAINKNNINSYKETLTSVKNAAKLYISDHRYDSSMGFTCLGVSESVKEISLETLVNNSYLTTPITNNCTNEEIPLSEVVIVTFDCTTREYSYSYRNDVDLNNDIKSCDDIG